MARTILDPFRTLFDIQRSLDSSRASDWLSGGPSGRGAYPLINIFRQGDDLVIITELPGIKRDDVQVQVRENQLRIAGKKEIQYGDDISLHRRERISGAFDRTVSLPVEIDGDKVKAEYRDGILAIFLPRAERDKPRTITVH